LSNLISTARIDRCEPIGAFVGLAASALVAIKWLVEHGKRKYSKIIEAIITKQNMGPEVKKIFTYFLDCI
jgi:hypothetical protein